MASDDKLYDLVIQWDERRQQGEELPAAALCTDCPELIPALEERIASVKATDWLLDDDDEDDDFLSLPPQLTKKRFSVPESVSLDQFSESIVVSGVLTSEELQQVDADSANVLAGKLIGSKRLTEYQAKLIAEGNTKGLVLGNYVILDKIGAGGMGQVFKARHKRMKRIVALKTLPDKAVESATALERFHREVEAAARLEHPNVVTAFDADEFDGQHFLVMQHVDGDDLSSLVRKKGPMSVGHAVDCIIQAAKGLEYAHRKGVVHRDIKPANLLLDEDGTVKVLDLGLARFERTNGSNGFAITESELTTNGVVLGTVDYLAPEQALDTHSADGRSDIYSLGCTLHFLLTGKPVFTGSTLMAKMLAHREKEIPSLRDERDDVPERLEAIYEKMIAKKPDDRYATMTALLEDLESVATECEDTWKQELGDKSTVVDEPVSDLASRETSSSELSDTLVMPPAVEPEPEPEVVAESSGSGRRIFAGALGVLLLAGFGYWLFGILFSVETPDGIIQVESNVMDVDVFVDNEKVVHITDPKDNKKISVSIPKGAKMLRVVKEGFEADVKEFRLKTVKGPIKVSFVPLEKPAVSGDQHRALAEWVLGLGGNVHVIVNGKGIRSLDDLPQSPFQVSLIQVHQTEKIVDSDLARFSGLASLHYLSLLETPISDEGIAELEELPALKTLTLFGTKITDASLQRLHTFAPNLETLSVAYTAVTDDGLGELKMLHALEEVDALSCDNITESGLATLLAMDLVGCRVSGPAITGESLKVLTADARLRRFTISSSSINDDTLRHLTPAKLTSLSLDGNKNITDGAIEHLKKIETLKNLVILRTKITAEGVAELQQALPNCKIMWDGSAEKATSVAPMEKQPFSEVQQEVEREVAEWVLSIGGTVEIKSETEEPTSITDESQLPKTPFLISMIEVHKKEQKVNDNDLTQVAKLSALEILDVGYTDVTDDGLAHLSALKSLKHLNCVGTTVTEAGLRHLASLQLEWFGGPTLGDDAMELIGQHKNLTHLYIFPCHATDTGIRHLAGLTMLQHLHVEAEYATDSVLKYFSEMEELASLNLTGCGVTGSGFRDLQGKLPNLEDLSLRYTKLNDEGLAEVAKFIKTRPLFSLNLSNTAVTDEGLGNLEGAVIEQELDLRGTQVTADGVNKLREARTIRKVVFDGDED